MRDRLTIATAPVGRSPDPLHRVLASKAARRHRCSITSSQVGATPNLKRSLRSPSYSTHHPLLTHSSSFAAHAIFVDVYTYMASQEGNPSPQAVEALPCSEPIQLGDS